MKLRLLILLTCLSLVGCTVDKWELLKAEELCKDKGGVNNVEHFLFSTTVRCLNGQAFVLKGNN